MKMFALIAGLMISASAAHAEYVRYEPVIFQATSAYIPANKTCINNEGSIVHKTKTELPVCVTKSNSGSCTYVMKKIIPQPVVDTFTRFDCANDNQNSCVAVKYQLNQSTRKIFRVYGHDDNQQEVIGTYTIPACSGK